MPVKIRNAVWDLLFYDFRSLSHHQFYSALDPFVEQGAIVVISHDTDLNSCEGFDLFASDKDCRDQLETNRQRARENVDRLLDRYKEIDTVAIAGCGSSLVGAAAFGKAVAKARKKPVAAIVAGLGMRDLMGEVMSGALLFQPTNLAWGFIDWFLDEIRNAQRSVAENFAELQGTLPAAAMTDNMRKDVVTFSKATSQKMSDIGDSFRDKAKDAAKAIEKVTRRTQHSNALKLFGLSGEHESLTELFLQPSWWEGQIEESMLHGKELDDFVDGIPACAALRELLQRNARNTVLLVGHSKGAYAIGLVAWAMMRGATDSATKQAFEETAHINTFGCGVRLPPELKKVHQFIGEWDILGNLNTPGFHLPFLPRQWSLPFIKETINVEWQRRTLHTTSTLNPFSMPVVDLLEGLGNGGGGRGVRREEVPTGSVAKTAKAA